MSRVISKFGLFGLLLLTLVGTAIGLGLAIKEEASTQSLAAPLPGDITPILSPSTQPKEQSQIAPDGKFTLWLSLRSVSQAETQYQLFVEDVQTSERNLVYTENFTDESKFFIPFNTWSPGNKFFFIKQVRADGEHFLVFNADGTAFEQGPYLDITNFYKEAEIDFDLDDVTGWAAPTLLLVLTINKDMEKGPSYWFEVPSKKFIRLSTQF